ncbi:hypothetical protein [Vibrio vulnificus]|uniref:hypothetical protein n=1 Tax=Vibrio vulnificus TaxID=672 RepID=UPI0001F5BA1D|nr:hypothetical protein [Vibrio vulnificus]EWS66949.1 hypothetical protein Y702_23805 [Vibrio vulnificus BAA87]ADV88499.1 hypothetical protein VVMO6_03477 [Vibrio vulnificus MO6-24/O]EGR0040508.1 hypothetical protein [Vibrio vulnificus]EGR0090699.1 hypothetical protein [Vibrio vulnificus]EGR0096197.1 hypothetical protein [Vibrio vulnificus]
MQMKLPTLAALCLVTLLAGCSAHQKKEIKEGFTEVGHVTKDAAKKTGHFFRDTAKDIGENLDEATSQ